MKTKKLAIMLAVTALAALTLGILGSVRARPAGAQPALLEATGAVTFLRVHDVGTGYGGPSDHVDCEVVFRLDSHPNRRFCFKLRTDGNLPVRQSMFNLLRDAFDNGYTVTTDFWAYPGKNHSEIVRLWVTR